MGYEIYYANGRWQGYGVPAYCDYPGCDEVIDRGMGYQHPDDKENGSMYPEVFCCHKHNQEMLESFGPESKEHPEWLKHVLTDASWEEWRIENPEIVGKYTMQLKSLSSTPEKV